MNLAFVFSILLVLGVVLLTDGLMQMPSVMQ